MIAVVSVEIQAANPSMPLYPWRAYVNSPSSLRIRNVPRRVGNWNIDKVYVSAAYPDGSIKSAECVLVGGIWVCTIAGSTISGFSQNGYTIFADGKDENGNEVTGYCLGKGDITILEADGTITPGEDTHYVHMLSAQPTTPKEGDLWQLSGTWYIYQDGTSYPIGDDSGLIQQLTERVDDIETTLSDKADISSTVLNPIYSQTPTFSQWVVEPVPLGDWSILFVVEYGESDAWLLRIGEDFYPCFADESAVSLTFDVDSVEYTATRTRTDLIGYMLGDQDDKPLASANALSTKQDKLSDPQISAIDSVVDERATYVEYQGGTISSFNIVGELDSESIPDKENAVEVKFGNTVTRIGGSAFFGCNSLSRVKIPDSVMGIIGGAFFDCTGLTGVTIPDSVTSIGSSAFSGCIGLSSVTIPDGVTSIGNSAFYGCTGLTSMTIPNNVTSIGDGAFFGCTNLSNVTVVGKTQAQAETLLADAGVSPSIITTWNDASQEWVKDQNYLSSVPSTYKTYNDTLSSLSSDGYATTTYAVHNLSGVANITSMPLSSYESISATADAETLYVITED